MRCGKYLLCRQGRRQWHSMDVTEGHGFEWETQAQSWTRNINFDTLESIIYKAKLTEYLS